MNQLQKVLLIRTIMGWWPFSKPKPSARVIEPISKDGRTWLLELRDMCERNFDNPEEAKRRIRQMQVEWQECLDNGSLSSINKEALESKIVFDRDYLIDYFGFKTLERAYLMKIKKFKIKR